MTEGDSFLRRVRCSVRDLLVATAVVVAMIAFPWAAVGLLLVGSVVIALFARRRRRVAAWTFAVVAWLTALSLVPLLPSWRPGPGAPRVDDVVWRLAMLRAYPVTIAGQATLAAYLSLRLPTPRLRALPLAVAVATLAAWLVFDDEGLAIRLFHVVLDVAMETLFCLEDGPPPDVDAFSIRPRPGFYVVLTATLAAAGYGLSRLVASYREDRRQIEENAARLRAELEGSEEG